MQSSVEVNVCAGNAGPDAQDCADTVLNMEKRWAERQGLTIQDTGSRSFTATGDGAQEHFERESGIHRLVCRSPHHPEGLRTTSFAAVSTIPALGSEDEQVRSYILEPYTAATDHRTERETSDVRAVLDGDLSLVA